MSTQGARLDHLVVTTPRLEEGVAWVEARLGCTMAAGGRHARMGTHNRLLRLGADVYLEVIAVDPDAPPPQQPRWFGLDDLAPDAPPRLRAWVAGCDAIEAACAACRIDLGGVTPMARDALHWRITIPADGRPPLDGLAPALIEWPAGVHPAAGLPDAGIAFEGLVLVHPQVQTARDLLRALGSPPLVDARATSTGEARHLAARLRVGTDVRTLD